jgi:ubiquinone biosynthesis protein
VPLDKLDFQASFHETMDVIRKYRVRVPRDFVLMGRALVAISGAVTQLDPSLDISSLAGPYSRKLLRQKISPSSIQRKLTSASYHLGSLLSQGPRDIRRLVGQLRRGQFEFTIRHEGFEKGLTELDHTGNRLSLSIILAAIIVASAMLLDAQVVALSLFGWRVSVLGLAGLLFGLILGVWLIVSILRSRRL